MAGDSDFRSRPRAFDGRGEWLDRPSSNLTYEERCERVRSFLREYKLGFPDEFIEVLAYCNTRTEIWFIREIVTSSGWQRVGERTLTNGLYKLTVKANLRGVTADLLFEDLHRGVTAAFQFQYPQHPNPGKAYAIQQRLAHIRRQVDRLIPIPADKARSLGKSFRVDLMKDRLAHLSDYERVRNPPTKHRFWSANELALDVSELPHRERVAIVRDWLRNKAVLPEAYVEALAICERAGEILFALQLLSLPNIELRNGSFWIHNLYRLLVQPEVEGQSVDFMIEPVSAEATRSRTIIEIDPPFQHFESTETLQRDAVLREMGYQVTRETAQKAKFLGYRWNEYIVADIAASAQKD